jgi:hypothetical protein
VLEERVVPSLEVVEVDLLDEVVELREFDDEDTVEVRVFEVGVFVMVDPFDVITVGDVKGEDDVPVLVLLMVEIKVEPLLVMVVAEGAADSPSCVLVLLRVETNVEPLLVKVVSEGTTDDPGCVLVLPKVETNVEPLLVKVVSDGIGEDAGCAVVLVPRARVTVEPPDVITVSEGTAVLIVRLKVAPFEVMTVTAGELNDADGLTLGTGELLTTGVGFCVVAEEISSVDGVGEVGTVFGTTEVVAPNAEAEIGAVDCGDEGGEVGLEAVEAGLVKTGSVFVGVAVD